ncbi:serine/threonine-protein kinase ZRK1-like [Quercus suber]|uniref:serine/threonine-protein kinase ZRK1-like n=1 Tax=Quercus suber TaxID=58331 RepID=UPI0032DEEE30
MQEYLNQVKRLQSRFESFTLLQIIRSRNTHVDSFTTLATFSVQSLPRVILVEDLCKPTKIKKGNVQIHQIRVAPSWMDSIVLFLKEGILPEERAKADKVKSKDLEKVLGRNSFWYGFWRRKERERAFFENGSKLLEKLIASCNGRSIPIRTFSDQHEWFWYKGSLEARIVFVKRLPDSKVWADLAINDLVMSVKMSAHSNVLNPIGSCLETPSPILVYQFAANGFLMDRIYVSRVTKRKNQPMVWMRRLKIARHIAYAISYLHTAFHGPVIHMAIRVHGILLDEHDVPKLCNLFHSVSLPGGETDVKGHEVLQNFRFYAPEFRASGKVMEKTDVYDFGRFLLELLTGENSYHIIRLTINEDGEGGASLQRQLQAVVDLALTCTEEDPHRRPTMVDVTKGLRRIERFTQVDEETLGSLRNLKLHERFEEHASASLKRNVSNDESQAVKEASEA